MCDTPPTTDYDELMSNYGDGPKIMEQAVGNFKSPILFFKKSNVWFVR